MVNESVEKKFASRFDWRRGEQIERMVEFRKLIDGNENDFIKYLPEIALGSGDFDIQTALKRSIMYLGLEVFETYVFGQFQSCFLACSTLVERCLKLAYIQKTGNLPEEAKRWTLGRWIEMSNGITSPEVLDIASQFKNHRNSMVHGKLDHEDPEQAILGGNRSVRILSSHRYLIYPYQGDAQIAVKVSWQILGKIFT